MPTYEYQCPKGHAFELFQRISDKPRAKCPACGARASRIISGGAGLIFKGAGFYITDYGKDGKGPRQEAEPEAPKADASPSDATGVKPEPTPEPTPKKKTEKKGGKGRG
jgi:putative FmdB family regulatory protein